MFKKKWAKGQYYDVGRGKWRKAAKVDQALRIAKSNKKKINDTGIIKQGTITLSGSLCNATPVIEFIPAAGSGYKTALKSVAVKGTITGTHGNNYRVDLVLDRDPQGVEVTPLLVYGSATPNIYVYKNVLYKSRFKILRSKFGVHDTGRGLSEVVDWYVKLNLTCETTTIDSWTNAHIKKNALYLIYWTTATSNQTSPSLACRSICLDTDT